MRGALVLVRFCCQTVYPEDGGGGGSLSLILLILVVTCGRNDVAHSLEVGGDREGGREGVVCS